MSNREQEECRFSPQLFSSSGNPRTLSEFLEDQSRFLRRKQELPSYISEEKAETTPSINKNSAVLASKKPRDEPIYNRLYSIARKTVKVEEVKPKTRARTRERRELRLYQLAFEKGKEPRKVTEEKAEYIPKDDPLIRKVFKKEFTKALEEAKVEDKTDYESFKNIMKSLGFMQDNSPNKIVNLTDKLWNTLKLPDQDYVPIDLLEDYTAAILNIKILNTSLEVSAIAAKYKALYINRRSNRSRKEQKEENLSFMPSLCKESMKIAKSRYMSNRDTFKPSSDSFSHITDELSTKKV
eukprot:TRINITY_DN7650_c0_g4_i1.p1 TRINITY_DN7650_c0_g4~~TRINITY_DN7650_c0_g4_i1.p1  ORF type:complete len:296 (+),score=78.66 TRINITY_DN7650_c0_g4_i1:646-1533(+)